MKALAIAGAFAVLAALFILSPPGPPTCVRGSVENLFTACRVMP